MITREQLIASMRHETDVINAKESGNADIGPANCWVGRDPPKKPA